MENNSIYDYYQKISGRYWIAVRTPEKLKFLWEPMARPLIVKGYKSYDLFIARQGRHLLVCEGLSGAIIINQGELPIWHQRSCSRERFLRMVPQILRALGGKGAVNQAIVNFIFDNDQAISPRYKTLEP